MIFLKLVSDFNIYEFLSKFNSFWYSTFTDYKNQKDTARDVLIQTEKEYNWMYFVNHDVHFKFLSTTLCKDFGWNSADSCLSP